jgi:shikimate dehydrogenase
VDKYGLIGASLKHSFSENYFKEKFRKENIQAIYNNYEIADIDQLSALIASNDELKGLNVTIPYKKEVIHFIDKLDSTAAASQAVNTIRIKRKDGTIVLEGFNTDAPAFKETIKPLLKRNHRKALILGTGGAAYAVAYSLETLSVSFLMISRLKTGENIINYDAITQEIMHEHSVIINCTPVGMYPHVNDFPPFPYDFLTAGHLVYDLIYNPEQTVFLKKASQIGATTKNGLDMLHRQAELAWEIWNS